MPELDWPDDLIANGFASDPELADDAEVAKLQTALTALFEALPQQPAPVSLRARLLRSIEAPETRYAPFIDRLAKLVDVGTEAARSMLAKLCDPAAWEYAPKLGEGIALIHLDGGPRVAAADVGFVQVPAGQLFPDHRHHGRECVLILQGSLDDSSGEVLQAGDYVELEPGSQHHFRAREGDPLIYAVTVFGVTFPGIEDPFGPG